MNKTKQKILDTALQLFNAQGLSNISLRGIAIEMGISQGNLSYHFKKREDIIEQLYHQLVKNIDHTIEKLALSTININTIYAINKAIAHEFYEFRFFLLDFTQIMRNQEVIRVHYNKLLEIRKQQMMFFIEQLIKQQLLRPEQLENEYENLYTRIQILNDFWMSSLSIQQERISTKTTQKYVDIIFENIYPYLTEKGIEEYNKTQLLKY